jgi:hypothetical protein
MRRTKHLESLSKRWQSISNLQPAVTLRLKLHLVLQKKILPRKVRIGKPAKQIDYLTQRRETQEWLEKSNKLVLNGTPEIIDFRAMSKR